MKQKYLLEKTEMVKIPTPEKLNDLIGKYYLFKLKSGRNCFYPITSIDVLADPGVKLSYDSKNYTYRLTNEDKITYTRFLKLSTAIEGCFNYGIFPRNNLPPFYEKKMTKNKVLFNVWE